MAAYIHAPVEEPELRSLVMLARKEEEAFFQRNPRLAPLYRDRLIAVALCQGAALQYLRYGYGVKDFDVHFFYAQNPKKLRLSRAVKRISATVGRFRSTPVDFIRTVIPVQRGGKTPLINERIASFLDAEPTANAMHLAEKAVIGLFPANVFGETLWRAETAVEGAAYHRMGMVKVVAVHEGQGKTAEPDANEIVLAKHLGESCEIAKVARTSIQLRLNTGELVWAVPEEVSRDLHASVRRVGKTVPSAASAVTKSKAGPKPKLRRRTGRDRLDLSLFRTSRVYRPGSGQTRQGGSRRDNKGHR